MNKLVVFSALLAVAVAAPGNLFGHSLLATPLVHAAPYAHAIPAAVSHQSRVDVIKPVARIVHAAPLSYGHHGLAYGHGLTYGHGYASGLTYGHGLGYGSGLGYGHGLGYPGLSYGSYGLGHGLAYGHHY